MTKNPFINSLAAALYIAIIASLLFYGKNFVPNVPDTIFAPIAMLSLFVLSAAVMGYIFLSQPIQMYLDGSKKPALKLFGQTLVSFAVITVIAFILLVSIR